MPRIDEVMEKMAELEEDGYDKGFDEGFEMGKKEGERNILKQLTITFIAITETIIKERDLYDHSERFYMGIIPCEILSGDKKKKLVRWKRSGIVGNKTEGHKQVYPGEQDIVPTRLLWRNKK